MFFSKLFNSNRLDSVYLKFLISCKTTKLTNIYHYDTKQQHIYDVVKELKEIKGYGYRRISHYLIERGYKTVRSNKPILPNYVYSIYKKGKIREERINREYDYLIHNVRLFGR